VRLKSPLPTGEGWGEGSAERTRHFSIFSHRPIEGRMNG
jgi:hypothetical protein